MMEANRVRFDRDAGGMVYVAGTGTGGEYRLAVQGVETFDVVAGDDIRVRSRRVGSIEVESLSEPALLVRELPDRTVRVRTTFGQDAAVEVGGLKEGEPVRPRE